MKVIRSGLLGFCMGVRRAVDAARNESLSCGRVYTLGPLIHNPRVLGELKERGIEVLEDSGGLPEDKHSDLLTNGLKRQNAPETVLNSTVIIRAHGVSPHAENELIRRGARIVDATCPHVKASQNKARSLSRDGYFIFLAGEENHAEITGIRGYIEGHCCIVANPAEAERAAAELAKERPSPKTALMGQTTISAEEYRAIGQAIGSYFPGLAIIDTLCTATRERQNALREMAGRVDAFIIAGGRGSANTRRLLSIAESCGKKAWIVESSAEIPEQIRSYETVGLCSGTSTPDSLIDEIENALEAF